MFVPKVILITSNLEQVAFPKLPEYIFWLNNFDKWYSKYTTNFMSYDNSTITDAVFSRSFGSLKTSCIVLLQNLFSWVFNSCHPLLICTKANNMCQKCLMMILFLFHLRNMYFSSSTMPTKINVLNQEEQWVHLFWLPHHLELIEWSSKKVFRLWKIYSSLYVNSYGAPIKNKNNKYWGHLSILSNLRQVVSEALGHSVNELCPFWNRVILF